MQANPNHGTCDRTALHGRGAAISPERYPCLAHALIAVLLRVQQSMTYALSMHTVALHIPMCNVLMVRCDQAPFMLHCHTILCCTPASPCCVCVMHDPCHVSIVRCIMLAPLVVCYCSSTPIDAVHQLLWCRIRTHARGIANENYSHSHSTVACRVAAQRKDVGVPPVHGCECDGHLHTLTRQQKEAPEQGKKANRFRGGKSLIRQPLSLLRE